MTFCSFISQSSHRSVPNAFQTRVWERKYLAQYGSVPHHADFRDNNCHFRHHLNPFFDSSCIHPGDHVTVSCLTLGRCSAKYASMGCEKDARFYLSPRQVTIYIIYY